MELPLSSMSPEYQEYLSFYIERTRNSKEPKIMVLDDDKFALVQICRELNKVVPGANIYATSSTSEAIRWTQIVDLEFIFLDFQLPDGKNGLELARLLSRLNPRAKLIIFSGIPRFEFQEQCQKTELALPFLEKPISKEDLARLIGGGGSEYGN